MKSTEYMMDGAWIENKDFEELCEIAVGGGGGGGRGNANCQLDASAEENRL
jgi:hypothetical protein